QVKNPVDFLIVLQGDIAEWYFHVKSSQLKVRFYEILDTLLHQSLGNSFAVASNRAATVVCDDVAV
ncbi:MAG TPA: hypothetical protein VEB67_01240, partial [Nitrososphaerales archaeon]|nr:hypothetical protein [Nitrososphaerales archaeon]